MWADSPLRSPLSEALPGRPDRPERLSVFQSAAIDHLRTAAAALADIHRPKHFAVGREETRHRLDADLSASEPFKDWTESWIFTGDGGRVAVSGRFGEWAIDRLVDRLSPEDILGRFDAEVHRNAATYAEVSPLFGVQVDEVCELDSGVALEPAPAGIFEQIRLNLGNFNDDALPEGTGFLRQTFNVSPAFVRRVDSAASANTNAETRPIRAEREAVRARVRLACLLASAGPVELPLSVLRPDRSALFTAGDGDRTERPSQLRPHVAFPVKATEVKAAYAALSDFNDGEAIARAINRLGRSRMAANDVDRAMELGMAAEIALMHGASSTNTEITYKIASRAAWLIGGDVEARLNVFEGIRALYRARSSAVHSGALSARAVVNLAAADELVAKVLLEIARHEQFPDWDRLVLGGGSMAVGHRAGHVMPRKAPFG